VIITTAAHARNNICGRSGRRNGNGAIDLPNEKRGRKNPRIGDRVRVNRGPFVGHTGICAQISR